MLYAVIKRSLLISAALWAGHAMATPNYSASIHQPKIRRFINKMVQQDHYPRQQLIEILQQQQPNQQILDIEHRPYEKESWPVFKKQHVTQQRIEEGERFFHDHEPVLMQMQKQYGVDPYVITAILGFESNYGHDIGHYRALDSLYTLGFYYPPRQQYFENELESLLLLARDWHKPVQSIISSFDGGLGMAQFMPDKYRQEAVAYSANHFPDLLHNANDAIVSIAKYLNNAGWQANGWIVKSVLMQAYVLTPMCKSKPQSMNQLRQQGLAIPQGLRLQKAGCAHLEDNEQTDYWLLGSNFYAIKKYNPDLYYALVIEDLSDGIRAGMAS